MTVRNESTFEILYIIFFRVLVVVLKHNDCLLNEVKLARCYYMRNVIYTTRSHQTYTRDSHYRYIGMYIVYIRTYILHLNGKIIGRMVCTDVHTEHLQNKFC